MATESFTVRRSPNWKRMSRLSPNNSTSHLAGVHQSNPDAFAPWANPWGVCWRRKKTILAVFLLGSLATILFWQSRPEVYRSSAQLLLIAGTGNSDRNESASSVQARISSHMEQIKSPLVVNRVVKKVFETSFPEDDARKASSRLKLENRHNLLKLTYSASSAALSQEHLAEIISGYQGYLMYTPQSNHLKAIKELTSKKAHIEEQLAENQSRYARLLKPTPFAGTNRDVHDQIDERLQRLKDKREAMLIRKSEVDRLLAAQPTPEGVLRGAENNLAIPELSQAAAREVYAMELRERLISARARGKRPELRRAAEDTQQARQLYAEIGQQSALVDELAELKQSISALDNLLKTEQRQADQWNKVATETSRLRTQIAQQEQSLGSLERQLQHRQLASELESCQLQVIAPPREGSPRSKKSILLYYLLPGILGSTVLALFAGCCVEFIDRGFHTPSEIPRTTGAPLMGVLPYVSQEEAASEPSALGGLIANYKISHSAFAEQFRKIRTALIHNSPTTRGQVILVTSFRGNDGRTVCSSNLAAVLAQAGKRTLIVDTCFYAPQLHETFGVGNDTGLADVLSHSTAWQKLVQPTLLADVDLLTSGQANSSSTELLSSPQWVEFLDAVRNSYDYLILDGPGFQESLDPIVLANSADQIILLLRIGKTSRLDALQMLDSLGAMAPRIVGVILNNVKNKRQIWNADPLETYRRMHQSQLPLNAHLVREHNTSTIPSENTSPTTTATQNRSGRQNSAEEALSERNAKDVLDLVQEISNEVARATSPRTHAVRKSDLDSSPR